MMKKLLSKAKPLDIALLVILIGFITALVLFLYRKTEYVTVRVKVTETNLLYAKTSPQNWIGAQFRVGDIEYDSMGKVKSTITAVRRYDVSESLWDRNPEAKQLVYLDIHTKAVYDSRQKTYQVNGQPLGFGAQIRFLFQGVQFDGFVTDVDMLPDLYAKTTHVVEAALLDPSKGYSETYGVQKYIADAVKVGDQITDSTGQPFITVINVTKKPALRSIITPQGVIITTDPLLFDVTYTLEVAGKTIDQSTYLLDSLPLKIGVKLPLNFQNIYINPTITEIRSIDEKSE